MANSVAKLVCLLMILLTAVPSTLATDYTVGDSPGWTLGADYTTWAKDKTFKVGDSLVFKYGSSHSVDEVKAADYSSCTVGNSITTDNSGSTTIQLKTAGTHYFICGVTGHCGSGMKLAVTVAAGGATPTPSESSSPSGTGTTTTPTVPATPASKVPAPSSSPESVSPVVAALFSACAVGLVYKLCVLSLGVIWSFL